MSFNPTASYSTVTDIDGDVFSYQGSSYYDRQGNSFSTIPMSKNGCAAPVDSHIVAALTSGSIDGVAIGANAACSGVFTSGTINGMTIGASVASTGLFTTVKAATTVGVGAATPAAVGCGVTFPASENLSSNANTLDSYAEYTAASTACTGAITTACVWKLTKVGNLVTLTLPAVQGNGVATTNFTVGLAIPAAYRPAADFASVSAPIIDNAANQSAPGAIQVTSAGVISVWMNGTFSGNFTVTANAGLAYTTSVSWTI